MISNNYIEELSFINNCFYKKQLNNSDWDILKKYSSSLSYDVKYELCELLTSISCNQSEEILLSMLQDNDYMIRLSACDALKFSSSKKTLEQLIILLKDTNKLVRGYAALSIGDIQKRNDFQDLPIISILKLFLQKEHSVWTKTALARSLYLLGEYTYETVLLSSINNKYYSIRSFSLNLIIELIKNNDYLTEKNKLYLVLHERLKTEKTFCVINTINNLLDLINKTNQSCDNSMIDK